MAVSACALRRSPKVQISQGHALVKEHSLGSHLHKKLVERDNAIRHGSASKFTRSRAEATRSRSLVVVSWLARSRRFHCPCRQSRSRPSARPGASSTLGGHPMGIASPINGHVLLRLARYVAGTIRSAGAPIPMRLVSPLLACHAYLTCVYTRASVRKPSALVIQRRKRFHGCRLCPVRDIPMVLPSVSLRVVLVVLVAQNSPSLRAYYLATTCVFQTLLSRSR